MNKLTHSTLALALLCALTACSGGGSKGPNVQIPTVNNSEKPVQTNSANNVANNNSTVKQVVSKPSIPSTTENKAGEQFVPSSNEKVTQPSEKHLDKTGLDISKERFERGELNHIVIENQDGKEIAQLSGYNRAYSFNGAVTKSKDPTLGSMVVDNVVVRLAQKVGVIGGLKGLALSKSVTTMYNLTHNPERDIFYFGAETAEANIPKTGVVTYKGNASRYDNLTASVKNIGKSELEANFDDKKIKGELALDGFLRRNISLKETNIIGNGFNGVAVAGENSIFTTRDGEYEGKFFGPNAEEVAGKARFFDGDKKEINDLATSFSAEQVK